MISEPIFEPTYLSLEYIFGKVLEILRAIYEFILSDLFYNMMLILSLLFLAVAFYTFRKYIKTRREELNKLNIAPKSLVSTNAVRNPRWARVEEHLVSPDPHRWQLAIIEADVILDEMTRKMGVPGENLGERLKSIERSDFFTLDLAWEGHKVRNQIAHEGSTFNLTRREAKRIIDLFREVFKEFNYI